MKIRKTMAMIMALSILSGNMLSCIASAAEEETTAQEEKEVTYTYYDEESNSNVNVNFKVSIYDDDSSEKGYKAENPVTIDNVKYDIFEDHAAIFGYEEELKGDLVIPSEIKGVPVTVINKEAFIGCEGITSVVFPESITAIGEGAFKYCDNIKSAEFLCDKFDIVDVKDAYDKFDGIFLYCSSLEEVTYKATFREDDKYVQNINYLLFSTKGSAPDREIDSSLFTDLTKSGEFLCGIVIPNSFKKVVVTDGEYIPTYEFASLLSLEEVVLPDSLKKIKWSAFSDCINLKKINLPDSLTYIGAYAFSSSRDIEFGDLILPSKLETIGVYAFAGAKKLDSVKLPASLKKIGASAFQNCENLKKVTFDSNPVISTDLDLGQNLVDPDRGCGVLTDCPAVETVEAPENTFTVVDSEGYSLELSVDEAMFSSMFRKPEPGDVNYDYKVNLADSVRIMQSLSNPEKFALSSNERIIADVSNKGDGVTNKDALAIQKYTLKLIKRLPEEE